MKIIIVGGGFAGLQLAKRLNNKKGVELLLIDQYNYHQFQPLFYQVATAGLDASNISFPLRKIFQESKNLHIRLAQLQEIKANDNIIITSIGNFNYDVLVLATGAETNFFNNEHIREFAFPMKSTSEALQIRHSLIQNFEDALSEKDANKLQQRMNLVIVGGGPTGVEVSGALAEMRNNILPKDYPELDFSKMNIFLLEGSPKTLGVMSEKSSEQSCNYLHKLGVQVRTDTHVKDYDGENIMLSNGENIPAKIVIWAAGIKGNVPAGISADVVVKGNRIKVDRFNKVLGTQNIYAIGDIANMETPKYPTGHPQLANVAIHQAKNLAKNFITQFNHPEKKLTEFEYHDKGTMATVGRNLAVVDIPKPRLHFGGWIAWMMWMVLHLLLILGVKNRLQILINWVYKYFTYDQSLRLLFTNFNRIPEKENTDPVIK